MRFIVICRIINAEVRVISRAEGEGDNSYLNIDNFAYHNKHIYIYNIAFLNSERWSWYNSMLTRKISRHSSVKVLCAIL